MSEDQKTSGHTLSEQQIRDNVLGVLKELAEGALASVLESVERAVERLAQVSTSERGWLIRLYSDGLNLEAKMAIETSIRERLQPEKFVVYFARKSKLKAADGPTASDTRPMAFGLTMQRRAIPGVRQVVMVGSGKGGVGKSTVSANLAVTLSSLGQRVGLLDADIYGPSAPMMFGLSGSMQVNQFGRIVPQEAHGVAVVSSGFLVDTNNPIIWRGPMVGKAIQQLCYDVDWGDRDVLIVDLPPGTGDVQITLIESLPIHGAVVVTTPQDIALIDAHRAVSMFQKLQVPIHGVVENMSMFTCPHCGEGSHIFGAEGLQDFCKERDISLLGHLPLDMAVRQAGDSGAPAALAASSHVGGIFRSMASKILPQI